MTLTDRRLHILVGITAILAPAMHTLTDIFEWATGGFSIAQLWINYIAFLMVPFLMLGLYSVQRDRIGLMGLVGAVLYGIAFIYFSHTSLYAIADHIVNYESLWERLGMVYTLHGVIMIIGGGLFGIASIRAHVFPRWMPFILLSGLLVNLIVGVIGAPALIQTLGSALRNLSIFSMGVYLVRAPK